MTKYYCHWNDGYEGGPFTEYHTLEEVLAFAGFTEAELEKVKALKVGDHSITFSPIGLEALTIKRLE